VREAHPQLDRQQPRGELGPIGEALHEAVVDRQLRAVRGRLLEREGDDLVDAGQLAEEQLEHPEVADLGRARDRLLQPLAQPLAARVGDRVVAAAATALLARLLEQPGLGEPLRLGVQLRVRERPEVPDAELDESLEVVRRARTAQGGDPEHEIGDGSEAQA